MEISGVNIHFSIYVIARNDYLCHYLFIYLFYILKIPNQLKKLWKTHGKRSKFL